MRVLSLKFYVLSFVLISLHVGADIAPEVRFERYTTVQPALIGGVVVEVAECVAWVIVSNELMQTTVPQAALDMIYGVGAVTGLTLADITLATRPIGPDQTAFRVAASYARVGKIRIAPTGPQNVADWMQFLPLYGITDDNLKTETELDAL